MMLIIIAAITLFIIPANVPAQYSKEMKLVSGSALHCAAGPDGTLHIVYSQSGIKYVTLSPKGAVSQPEKVADKGSNAWVAILADGSVHAVWDTYSESYYSNRIGGSWRASIKFPKATTQRNYFCQLSGGYSNRQLHASTWNMTKGSTHNNSVYRIHLDASGKPSVEYLADDSDGRNRAPSVLGPTALAPGNGKAYALISNKQSKLKSVSESGKISTITQMSNTPSGKRQEGCQLLFAGTEIVSVEDWSAVVGEQWGCVVQTLTRAKAGKKSVPVSKNCHEMLYTRGTYNPANNRVYILYRDVSGKAKIGRWNMSKESVDDLGYISSGKISGTTRGPGSGGIAPKKDGGVHVVYSVGSILYHRVIDGDQMTSAAMTNHVSAIKTSSYSSRILLAKNASPEHLIPLKSLLFRVNGRLITRRCLPTNQIILMRETEDCSIR